MSWKVHVRYLICWWVSCYFCSQLLFLLWECIFFVYFRGMFNRKRHPQLQLSYKWLCADCQWWWWCGTVSSGAWGNGCSQLHEGWTDLSVAHSLSFILNLVFIKLEVFWVLPGCIFVGSYCSLCLLYYVVSGSNTVCFISVYVFCCTFTYQCDQ